MHGGFSLTRLPAQTSIAHCWQEHEALFAVQAGCHKLPSAAGRHTWVVRASRQFLQSTSAGAVSGKRQSLAVRLWLWYGLSMLIC